jgi:hypothetical protein
MVGQGAHHQTTATSSLRFSASLFDPRRAGKANLPARPDDRLRVPAIRISVADAGHGADAPLPALHFSQRQGHDFAFPRQDLPGLCSSSPSKEFRGTGNAGCRPHPWPACNKKSRRQSPQARPEQPGIPRAMVYGLYVVSSVYRACLATVARKIACELDPSVGRSGQHDFARPLGASLVG